MNFRICFNHILDFITKQKLHPKNFKWPSNPRFAAASRHGQSQTAGTIAAVIFNRNENYFLFSSLDLFVLCKLRKLLKFGNLDEKL